MSKKLGFLLVALSCGLNGCGGSPKELPIAKLPHGGTLVTLPDQKGFAEILLESSAPAKKGSRAGTKSRLVAYFYGPDGTSEITPAPTDVKVKLGQADSSQIADLVPDAKQAGKFSSAPGDYPDGFLGRLDANVNGQTLGVDVRIR